MPRITIHILKSVSAAGPSLKMTFHGDCISIGRHTNVEPPKRVDLNLQDDDRVSRNHARLVHVGGTWHIEDLGSANGTYVNGDKLVARNPLELTAGAMVQTGGTLWMAFPPDWQVIFYNGVAVSFPCRKLWAYVLSHCHVPMIEYLVVRNFSQNGSRQFSILFDVPELCDSCIANVPVLSPYRQEFLSPPDLRLKPSLLRRQSGPVSTMLHVRVTGQPDDLEVCEIGVIGFNGWPYAEFAVRTLPAFVRPHDPLIARIVLESEKLVWDHFKGKPFHEMLTSGDERAAESILASFYAYLAQSADIGYEKPCLEAIPGFPENKYQSIKKAGDIFPFGYDRLRGHGTCLDLALLFASCLEKAGIPPVIVLTGDTPFEPGHAFAGCRTGPLPGSLPIITDKARIEKLVALNDLVLVECTGCAKGGEYPFKLSFAEAKRAAGEIVHAARWVCLIEVGALRPPDGNVIPLEYAFHPVVAKIYEQAETFAKQKARKAVEARFLLFGVLAAGGGITGELLVQLGLNASDLLLRMDQDVARQEYADTPTPTVSFLECQQLAERFAWQEGAISVREQDVLWALLEKERTNAGLKRTIKLLFPNPGDLAACLLKKLPRPSLLQSTLLTDV
jgi:hypothetical protein